MSSIGLALVAAAGLFPGLAYFGIMIAGLAFGVLGPARFLVWTLLKPVYSDVVLYAIVLGGSALSAVLSLSGSNSQKIMRMLGWIAVLLLFVNTPMCLFQFHVFLVHGW